MIKVVLLGAGNVAHHLFTAFMHQESVAVVQCYNRKGILLGPSSEATLVTNNINAIIDADIYILAISDDAITEVSSQLSLQNKLVVHTSGSVAMNALNDKNRKGVFYPLQTFSKHKVVDFSQVPFCLEAEEKSDIKLLKNLANLLSDKVYEISSLQRNILHVSAVFVNNFSNHLFSMAKEICDTHSVPFEILHPLLLETAQKTTQMDPKAAQTGPAIREDENTIDRHLEILSDPLQIEIYKIITRAIQSTHGKKL